MSLSLHYTAQRSFADLGDTTDYVLPIAADIIGTIYPADDTRPTLGESTLRLGTLELLRIQVGNATNDGFPLLEVFDGRQETMDAGAVLYGAAFEEFRPLIGKQFPEAIAHADILLVHRLVVFPFARGQDVGLAALHRAIRDWESGCALVVLKAYPLQFESEAEESPAWEAFGLENLSQDESLATRRLRAHYERLGFRRIGQTDYLGLSPAEQWLALDPETLPASVRLPQSALPSNGPADE
ncbi:MAG: hypothetical protein WC661_18615 [Opitutaceae bacterium]